MKLLLPLNRKTHSSSSLECNLSQSRGSHRASNGFPKAVCDSGANFRASEASKPPNLISVECFHFLITVSMLLPLSSFLRTKTLQDLSLERKRSFSSLLLIDVP